ncbi:hypothetical protein MPAR168_06155 [Methylorubrum populi]|uniref:Uncharacterized protein n=1 Tax=Methylobacterium radiotolerans TaxID=31998 RepID=A0ABU7T732_9HYPH
MNPLDRADPEPARGRRSARRCLILLAAAALTGPAAAAPSLLEDWAALNSACRGGRGDDPRTLEACTRRDALDQRLTAAGWCYGRPGEAGYQRRWRLCTSSRQR